MASAVLHSFCNILRFHLEQSLLSAYVFVWDALAYAISELTLTCLTKSSSCFCGWILALVISSYRYHSVDTGVYLMWWAVLVMVWLVFFHVDFVWPVVVISSARTSSSKTVNTPSIKVKYMRVFLSISAYSFLCLRVA